MYDSGIGKDFESRLWISSQNGDKATFTQNLAKIKKPDSNLTDFIQEQAPSYKYSWSKGIVTTYQPPTSVTQPPKKQIVKAQEYPQSALDNLNNAIMNTGIDFNGGKVAQAKSEKIINEQVMPVVQTGVGLAEVGTGTAMCASGVGCGIGSALIIHGSDNVATGATNRGKTSNQQTSSVLLTQGVGLSEGTASNIKMGTDLALGGVTAAQGVSRRVASGVSGTAGHSIPQSVINKARIENNVNVDNPSFGTTASGIINFGSAESHIYKSTIPIEDVFPELKGINPHYVENAPLGVNTNCVSCANATSDRLNGIDLNAIASPSHGYKNMLDLRPTIPFGTKVGTFSPTQVIDDFLKRGDGTTGAVIINQPSGISHVINVVNKDGKVYFIDSQIGKIVELQDNLLLEYGVR